MNQITTKSREFHTGNYSLATSLRTVGFPWQDPQCPCHNVYVGQSRPERDHLGRLSKLGNVTFYISRQNEEAPEFTLEEALRAYDGMAKAGAKLDELLAGDGDVSKARVRELLPAAYVECSKHTLANRKTVANEPHLVPAHIRFENEKGFPVVVSENLDPELAAEWGIHMEGGQS